MLIRNTSTFSGLNPTISCFKSMISSRSGQLVCVLIAFTSPAPSCWISAAVGSAMIATTELAEPSRLFLGLAGLGERAVFPAILAVEFLSHALGHAAIAAGSMGGYGHQFALGWGFARHLRRAHLSSAGDRLGLTRGVGILRMLRIVAEIGGWRVGVGNRLTYATDALLHIGRLLTGALRRIVWEAAGAGEGRCRWETFGHGIALRIGRDILLQHRDRGVEIAGGLGERVFVFLRERLIDRDSSNLRLQIGNLPLQSPEAEIDGIDEAAILLCAVEQFLDFGADHENFPLNAAEQPGRSPADLVTMDDDDREHRGHDSPTASGCNPLAIRIHRRSTFRPRDSPLPPPVPVRPRPSCRRPCEPSLPAGDGLDGICGPAVGPLPAA